MNKPTPEELSQMQKKEVTVYHLATDKMHGIPSEIEDRFYSAQALFTQGSYTPVAFMELYMPKSAEFDSFLSEAFYSTTTQNPDEPWYTRDDNPDVAIRPNKEILRDTTTMDIIGVDNGLFLYVDGVFVRLTSPSEEE